MDRLDDWILSSSRPQHSSLAPPCFPGILFNSRNHQANPSQTPHVCSACPFPGTTLLFEWVGLPRQSTVRSQRVGVPRSHSYCVPGRSTSLSTRRSDPRHGGEPLAAAIRCEQPLPFGPKYWMVRPLELLSIAPTSQYSFRCSFTFQSRLRAQPWTNG